MQKCRSARQWWLAVLQRFAGQPECCCDSVVACAGMPFMCTCRQGFMVDPANKFKCVQQVRQPLCCSLSALPASICLLTLKLNPEHIMHHAIASMRFM